MDIRNFCKKSKRPPCHDRHRSDSESSDENPEPKDKHPRIEVNIAVNVPDGQFEDSSADDQQNDTASVCLLDEPATVEEQSLHGSSVSSTGTPNRSRSSAISISQSPDNGPVHLGVNQPIRFPKTHGRKFNTDWYKKHTHGLNIQQLQTKVTALSVFTFRQACIQMSKKHFFQKDSIHGKSALENLRKNNKLRI